MKMDKRERELKKLIKYEMSIAKDTKKGKDKDIREMF